MQLSDMGAYRCTVVTGHEQTMSTEGHLQLEGKSQWIGHIVISVTLWSKEREGMQSIYQRGTESDSLTLVVIVKQQFGVTG